MAFVCLQRGRLQPPWASCIIVLSHSHSKKVFLDVSRGPPVFQFVPVTHFPVTEYHWEWSGSTFFTVSLQILHISYTFCLNFVRILMFIHVGYLALLSDFLLVRMSSSWVERMWFLRISQLYWTLLSSISWASFKQILKERKVSYAGIQGCDTVFCPASSFWIPPWSLQLKSLCLWPSCPQWVLLCLLSIRSSTSYFWSFYHLGEESVIGALQEHPRLFIPSCAVLPADTIVV